MSKGQCGICPFFAKPRYGEAKCTRGIDECPDFIKGKKPKI